MTTAKTTAETTAGTPADRPRSRGLLPGLVRKPVGVASGIVLAVVVVACLAGPLLAPHDPLAQDLRLVRQGPGAQHWLGTDSLGRDVLSRLLVGGRQSLAGVLEAVVTMLVIAVPLGVLAGHLGGRVDRVVMRAVDVVLSIPGTIITLAVLAIFDGSMLAAMVSVGVLASGAFTRIFRSVVLGVRQELYIDAARVAGVGEGRIVLRHVLPQLRGVLLVQVSLFAAATLGIQTGLAFLSFGPPPPAPTWGGMVAEAASLVQIDPWLLVPSGGVIALTTLALCLLADALRDANQERFTAGGSRGRRARPAAVVSAAPDPAAVPGPSPEEALLSVRGLRVGFGEPGRETVVVDGVDLDVAPGEVVGLVGESGSGKTVTALAVLGLLGPNGRILGGSVRFAGEELVGLPSRRLREVRGAGIAMISQEPMVALDPSFRVGSQIGEAVRAHQRLGRREVRARVEQLLRSVRLEPDVARRYPHEISGGMAQRVAIAIALAGGPRLLIADEPTTALDVTVQAEVLDLLRSLQERTGTAVVLVSHDWGVIADLCGRAVVMYAGQVVEDAPVRATFSAPRHPYTLALLRSNPHDAEPGQLLPVIGGVVPAPSQWPVGCRFAARCAFATDRCRSGPVPVVQAGTDRTSRCVHVDRVAVSS